MIKNFTTIKMRFCSPLHLSRGKVDSYESSDSVLHSDTLKSAIYVSAQQVCSDGWAEHFMHDIRISSAFPFESDVYYLPLPLNYNPKINPAQRKEIKKVKYVPISQFELIAKGEHPSLFTDGKANQPKIWEADLCQRVRVNNNDENEPFYIEKLYSLGDHAGLYFMVADLSDFDKAELLNALALLSENGLGMQRNLGNGRFKFSSENLSISISDKLDDLTAYMNISLYYPATEAELDNNALNRGSYNFIKRGGWISSPEEEENISLRKKSILMFSEGSVFPFEKTDNLGMVVDLKPEVTALQQANKAVKHPIWRDGKAIFLPIRIQ